MRSIAVIVALALGIVMAAQAQPPISIEWSMGPDAPQATAGGMTGIIGDDLIVAGGTFWHNMDSKRYVRWTQIYNTRTGEWRMGPDLPTDLAYSMCAVVDGRMYVFGGRAQGPEPLAKGYVLSQTGRAEDGTAEYEWAEGPSLPEPLIFSMGGAIGSVIYCVGGTRDYDLTDLSHAVYALDTRDPDAGWKECAPLPGPLMTSYAVAACGGNLYAFGGYRPDTDPPCNVDDAYRYDVAADEWTRIRRLPFAGRAQTALALDDRHVLLFGFYVASAREAAVHGNDFGSSGSVLLYDTERDRYHALEPMPHGVAEIFFGLKGNMLYGAGGEWLYKIRSPFLFIGEIGPPTEEPD